MKISLITVCYNSEKTIEDTLKSVLIQTYDNYEYIIIDGKSTDSTLNIIKSFQKKFGNKLKIVSEKDNGLYDAMNKGVKMASGDIIGILNSDDIFANKNVFANIIENYEEYTDVLYANLLYCNSDFSKIERNYISGENKSLTFCPAHPTMYIRKKIYEKIGLYNLEYKIDADYDFMIRLNKAGVKFQYLKEYIVLMRIGGTSNGLGGYLKNFKDCYIILKNNHIKFPFVNTLIKSVKTILQIISRDKDVDLDKIRSS